MLKPNAEYNRRAAIIEGLRVECSATEIIRFFGYPISTIYDVVVKYMALEQSNESSSLPARNSYSKERIARIAVVEKAQALISDDSEQSLRKLAAIVAIDVSESTMHRIAEEDLRYKSYTLKIRQMLSEAVRSKVAENRGHPSFKLMEDISNNYALQGFPKCYIKGFFYNI